MMVLSVYVPGPDKRIDQVEEMTKEFTELKMKWKLYVIN
jgi:hypothetical protein